MTAIERSNIDDVMARLDRDEIASLPYGGVEVDRNGTILFYNQAEADITNREVKGMVGKNFFKEVAPCTNRPEFQARFSEIVSQAKKTVMFDYTFDNKMKPTRVTIQMKKSTTSDSYWIFVKRS